MGIGSGIRCFLAEETHDFAPHERSPVSGSPATPQHGLVLRLSYAMVSLLLGLTLGLGNALVTVNPAALGEATAFGAAPLRLLSVAHVAIAIFANLLLIKMRQQYGLRPFALTALILSALIALGHLITPGLPLALAVRAAAGFTGAALMPLTLFYMMQAMPAPWRLKGIVLALGVTQCAVPLAHLLSPVLLAVSGWHSLVLLEAGLAFLSLAAVGTLRLPPANRADVLRAGDLPVFALFAGGLAGLVTVLAMLPIIGLVAGVWLGIAIPAIAAAVMIELRRAEPLLDLRWIARGDIARVAVAIFVARIVFAEQDVAIASLRSLGATADQHQWLSAAMLAGAIPGMITSAILIDGERFARPMMLALSVACAGAVLASLATQEIQLWRLYLSQAAIAFASTYFMGPALLLGITNALRNGNRELISFIVLFGVINSLGSLAGPVIMDAVTAAHRAAGDDDGALREAARLSAIVAAAATTYLGILLILRKRRRRMELLGTGAAIPSASPLSELVAAGWRPPKMGLPSVIAMSAIALTGTLFLIGAWGLIPI